MVRHGARFQSCEKLTRLPAGFAKGPARHDLGHQSHELIKGELMLKDTYQAVMHESENPLRQLPKMVRFHYMMILAFMWCSIFTVWTGWLSLYGPSILAHTVLLVGVFFTGDIFRRAEEAKLSHRDAMRNPHDGTALYDDLWGG